MVQSKAAVDDSVMRAAFAHPFLQRPAYGVPSILPNVSAYQQPQGLLGKAAAAQARTLSPNPAYYAAAGANAGAGWPPMVQGAYPAQWAMAAGGMQPTMMPLNNYASMAAFYGAAPMSGVPSVADNDAARWAGDLEHLSATAKSINAASAVASAPPSPLKRPALEPEPKIAKRQIRA